MKANEDAESKFWEVEENRTMKQGLTRFSNLDDAAFESKVGLIRGVQFRRQLFPSGYTHSAEDFWVASYGKSPSPGRGLPLPKARRSHDDLGCAAHGPLFSHLIRLLIVCVESYVHYHTVLVGPNICNMFLT